MLSIYILTGLSAGLIVIGWQGYKDSPYENFELRKFFRSLLVATLLGLLFFVLDYFFHIRIDNFGVLLLTIISIERVIGEIYKGFIRKKSHPEYKKLFVRLGVKFKTIRQRILAGIGFAFLAGGLIAISFFCEAGKNLLLDNWFIGALFGFLGGALSAIGGSIKDSQFEGFKLKKFIRSPIVGIIGGLILINFTKNIVVLTLSSAGFERVVVELYKTFIKKQVRGIFEGQKPKYPQWFKRRWIFMCFYFVGVLFLLNMLITKQPITY